MGVYYVTDPQTGLPTPVRISGTAPSPTEQQRIQQWVQSRAPTAPPPAQVQAQSDNPPGTALGRGFTTGLRTMQSLGGDAIEGLGEASGLEGIRAFGQRTREAGESSLEQRQKAGLITGLDDVQGVGTGLSYAGEQFASQVPIMAPSIAGGMGAGALAGSVFGPAGTLVGGVLGGAAGSLPFLFGGNRAEQRNEDIKAGRPVEIDNGAAFLASLPQAALEGIASKIVAFGMRPIGEGTGIFTRIVKRGTEGVLAEVPTEVGQEAIQIMQAGGDPTSDEAIQRYIEAAIAAGIVGGGLGAGFGAIGLQSPPDPTINRQIERDLAEEAKGTGQMIANAQANALLRQNTRSNQAALAEQKAEEARTAKADLTRQRITQSRDQYQRERQAQERTDLENRLVNENVRSNQAALAAQKAEEARAARAELVRQQAEQAVAADRSARSIRDEGRLLDQNMRDNQAALAAQKADEIRAVRAERTRQRAEQVMDQYERDRRDGEADRQAKVEFSEAQRMERDRQRGPTRLELQRQGRSPGPFQFAASTPEAAQEIQQDVAPQPQKLRLTPVQRREVEAQFPADISQQIEPKGKEGLILPQDPAAMAQTIRQTYDPQNGIETNASTRKAMMRLAEALEKQTPPVEQDAKRKSQSAPYVWAERAPFFQNVEVPSLSRAMRSVLDAMNLGDVGVSVRSVLDGDASIEGYEMVSGGKSAIALAADIYDPNMKEQDVAKKMGEVLSHEIIHALRSMGLISPKEWEMLSKAVRAQKKPGRKYTYLEYERAKNAKRGNDLTDEQVIEEAIAEMFRDHSAGRLKMAGAPLNIWKKIVNFIRRLGGKVQDLGYNSARDLFQGIQSGEVGARQRPGPASRGNQRQSKVVDLGEARDRKNLQDFHRKMKGEVGGYEKMTGPKRFSQRIVLGQRKKSPSGEAFVQELRQNYDVNPLNDRQVIINGQVAVDISPNEKGVHLHDIRTLFEGRKGEGTKALRELTNMADRLGAQIDGLAFAYSKAPGLLQDTDKLLKWYEKAGFRNEGGDREYGYKVVYYPNQKRHSKKVTDAILRATANQNFNAFFGESMVRAPNGKPLVLYHHGSFDESVDIPRTSLGMHFGTRNAAEERAFHKVVDDRLEAMEVYQADDGYWHFADDGLTSEDLGKEGWVNEFDAERAGILHTREAAAHEAGYSELEDLGNMTAVFLSIKNPKRVVDQGDDWSNEIIRAREEGHDGIVYVNKFEDKGSESWIAFEPTQIKSIANEGMFDTANPDIRKSQKLGGLRAKYPTVEDIAAEQRRYARALTGDVFFMPIVKGVESAKQNTATAKDWKAILSKMPGVKQLEIEWTGVNDWLDRQTGQVSKESLVDYLQGSQIMLEETVLGGVGEWRFTYGEYIYPDDWSLEAEVYMDEAGEQIGREITEWLHENNADSDELGWFADRDELEAAIQERAEELAERYFEPTVRNVSMYSDGEIIDGTYDEDTDVFYFSDLGEFSTPEEAMRAAQGMEADGPARHEGYTEDGGEKYREVLIRVPDLHERGPNANNLTPEQQAQWDDINARIQAVIDKSPLDIPEYDRLSVIRNNIAYAHEQAGLVDKKPFVRGGHFSETNIVVHARVKDRRDIDNRKVMFVEEIQSDLASDWRDSVTSAEQRQQVEAHGRWIDERYEARTAFRDLILRHEGSAAIKVSREFGFGDAGEVPPVSLRAMRLMGQPGGMSATLEGRRTLELSGAAIDQSMGSLAERTKYVSRFIDYLMEVPEIRDAAAAYHEIIGNEPAVSKNVIADTLPRTPFEGELTYQLMVKRLLREAAEGGYDKLSWTPGWMQARRWDNAARSVVEKITWINERNDDGVDYKRVNLIMSEGEVLDIEVDQAGRIMNSSRMRDELVGKTLTQLLGGQVAKRIMSEESGMESGQKITFGNSGYAIAYDQQIRRAVDKFARKFGSKVEEDRGFGDFGAGREISREVADLERAVREVAMYPEVFLKEVRDGVAEREREFIKAYREKIDKNNRALADPTTLYNWENRTDQDRERTLDTIRSANRSYQDRIDGVVRRRENQYAKDLRDALTPEMVRRSMVLRPGEPVWSVQITPEMREAAKKPQPMFSKRLSLSEIKAQVNSSERLYSRPSQQNPKTTVSAIKKKVSHLQYTNVRRRLNSVLGPIFGRDRTEEATYRIFAKVQDSFISIGDLMDDLRNEGIEVTDMTDPYLQEMLSHGKIGAESEFSEEGLYRPAMLVLRDLDIPEASYQSLLSVSPYVQARDAADRANETIMHKVFGKGDNSKLIAGDAYLYALHAKERNARIRSLYPDRTVPEVPGGKERSGSGMSDEEADAIIAWKNALPGGAKSSLEQFSKAVKRIITDTNRRRLESGLLSSDVVDVVKDEDGNNYYDNRIFKDYVPLVGKTGEEGQLIEDAGGAFVSINGVRGPEDKVMRGRMGNYAGISPFMAAMKQNYGAIRRAEHNTIVKSMANLVRSNPDKIETVQIVSKGPSKLGDQRYVGFKEDGRQQYLFIEDPRIARAFSVTLNPAPLNAWMKGLSKFTRMMANLSTQYNPEFLFSNMFRDVQTAMVNAGAQDVKEARRDLVRGVPHGWRAIRRYLREGQRDYGPVDYSIPFHKMPINMQVAAYREFMEHGGKNTSNQLGDLVDMEKRINGILREIGNKASKGQDAANYISGKAGSLLKFMEDYNDIVENATRLSFYATMRRAGRTPDHAAGSARNLTVNFSKKGEWGNGLNAWSMFFNASLQGTMVMFRLAQHPKVRAALVGAIAMGAMADAMAAAMSDEDEEGLKEYDKIPQHVLEHNWIIPTGNGYITIPMPYGFNAFFNVGRTFSRVMRGGYNPEQAWNTITATTLELLPLGGEQSFFNTVAPTIADPFVDIMRNKDFMDLPIYKEPFPGDPGRAQSHLYWNSTSATAKWITETLNDITGGTPIEPGLIDWNPDIMEFFFTYFTGGTGRFVLRTAEAPTGVIAPALTGAFEEEMVRQTPFARRLYYMASTREDTSMFMEKFDSIRLKRLELQDAIASQDPSRIKRAREKYSTELKLYGPVNSLNNARRKIIEMMNTIRDNPNIPDEEKQKRITLLKEREQMILKRGLQIMQEIR